MNTSDSDQDFVNKIKDSIDNNSDDPIEMPLVTDGRVLARVTDGIYRQPASAFRELISNAYDADATHVHIYTDAPNFSEIVIKDNGNGMNVHALVNLIRHIGGSAKRTKLGKDYNITREDPRLSPGGRKLIGKIGIGLFSVAQLTRSFTIITQPKGENYQLIARVVLSRYHEDNIGENEERGIVNSGTTSIKTVKLPDADIKTCGTTVIIHNVLPSSQKILRSFSLWETFSDIENRSDEASSRNVRMPAVHIGQLDPDGKYLINPSNDTKAINSIADLVESVISASAVNELYTQRRFAMDEYYNTIWTLSLSLPLKYHQISPSEALVSSQFNCYRLSNLQGRNANGQVTEFDSSAESDLILNQFKSNESPENFHVFIDGIQLQRPINFSPIPGSKASYQVPTIFVGSLDLDLSQKDQNQRGGKRLKFFGYFFHFPLILPKDNQGILIRINGASGTLFDSSFLGYQVSEIRRLKQITAELFVTEGLEESLNIDRESFNISHPHYVIVRNWVHNSLRQIFNKIKSLSATTREARRTESTHQSLNNIDEITSEELDQIPDSIRVEGVETVFTEDMPGIGSPSPLNNQTPTPNSNSPDGRRVFSRQKILDTLNRPRKNQSSVELIDKKVLALTALLEGYGCLSGLSTDDQQRLITAILRLFSQA